MANVFANVSQPGTMAQFKNALEMAPNIWEKFSTKVNSTSENENHVWLGMSPVPREMLGARQFAGMLDFTYNIVNKTYELSFIIDRESMEDDNHSLIQGRVAEAAQIWSTFKDSLLALLLEAGGTDTTFDGTAMFSTSRTIGKSGTIDNAVTSAAVDEDAPTVEEMLLLLKAIKENLWTFEDDQARPGYSASAMQTLNYIIPAKYERAAREAVQGQLVGGGNSNPFGFGLATLEILPYLISSNDFSYMGANGTSSRRGILYQERTPLEVVVLNGRDDISENNGVKVMIRQRFRMAYGDPRRIVRGTFT